jgi:hypothetical protein
MKFGKHTLKVIAVFVIMFLVGLIIKLFGLFDSNSVENFKLPDGYDPNMPENEFRNFVNQNTKGNNEVLRNLSVSILQDLSAPHRQIVQQMVNAL